MEPAVVERGEIHNKNFPAGKIPGMRPRSNLQRREATEKSAQEEANRRLAALKPKSNLQQPILHKQRDVIKLPEKKEEPSTPKEQPKAPGSLARLIQGK